MAATKRSVSSSGAAGLLPMAGDQTKNAEFQVRGSAFDAFDDCP